jgi:hypothetical protein
MILFSLALKKIELKSWWKKIAIGSLLFVALASPQAIDMIQHPDLYYSHPGPMILVDGKIPSDWYQKLATNIIHQLGMLHLRGDTVFRVNPHNEPVLDLMSGVFFLIGILGIFMYHRNKNFLLLLIPFFLLQLPSVLVLNFPGDVPSVTRTTSIIPFIFLICAIGVQTISRQIKNDTIKILYLGIIVCTVLWLNWVAYFVRYQDGLPNHNVAYDRVIASYIDHLPEGTQAIVVGSIWGDAGQPHPRAITYSMRSHHQLSILDKEFTKPVCDELDLSKEKDFFIVLSPLKVSYLQADCLAHVYQKPILTKFGDTVFIAVSSQPID